MTGTLITKEEEIVLLDDDGAFSLLYCDIRSFGQCTGLLQDAQREVSRTTIKEMLALFPLINHENVCDLLLQCAKHGAEQVYLSLRLWMHEALGKRGNSCEVLYST